VGSAELLAALSLATDLGTGAPSEHGLRTCVLAVRLGALAGVGAVELQVAFEVALMHALGYTADAHQAAQLYGDDVAVRHSPRLTPPGRARWSRSWCATPATTSAAPSQRTNNRDARIDRQVAWRASKSVTSAW